MSHEQRHLWGRNGHAVILGTDVFVYTGTGNP